MNPQGRMRVMETARLRGEQPTLGHLENLVCLLRNPRVAATLGGLRSRIQIRHVLERFMGAWKEVGYGPWVFSSAADGGFVGYGGLIETRALSLEGVELLYAISPEYWGQGLATELAAACTQQAFDDHRLSEIIAFTTKTNAVSRRVMEKSRFRYERDFEYVGLPHVLYRLRQSQWQSREPVASPNGR